MVTFFLLLKIFKKLGLKFYLCIWLKLLINYNYLVHFTILKQSGGGNTEKYKTSPVPVMSTGRESGAYVCVLKCTDIIQ